MNQESTGNERVASALIGIARTLERISLDIGELKEVLLREHRVKLTESRRSRSNAGGLLTESSRSDVESRLDGRTPLENVHAILDGEYIG